MNSTKGTVKIPWDYPFTAPKRTSYTEVVYIVKPKSPNSEAGHE
jgi:hypothetical protein